MRGIGIDASGDTEEHALGASGGHPGEAPTDEPKNRKRGRRRLSREQILAGEHRAKVGGKWDELGALQLEFLRGRGLEPHHTLVDVGCGALRGGVHFVRFLDPGNYHGLDIEPSLLEAGRHELDLAGLADRGANLLASDEFALEEFGTGFDHALSVSLFTHLDMNLIALCLKKVRRTLRGTYYASFFEAPAPLHTDPLRPGRGPTETRFHRNPYHYHPSEVAWLAGNAGLSCEYLGGWGHPSQKMLAFRPRRSDV